MILCIANVLTSDELATVRSCLEAGKFADGAATAGWHARKVKHNEQLPASAAEAAEARDVVAAALKRNLLLQMAALPRRMRPAMFSRYTRGMSYGTHIDDAVMWRDVPTRSDISLTLFLSDPASYTGGALVIDSTGGEQSFKLDAGALVIYPSSTLHRVEAVTQGVRLAAVSWIQSLVRDPAQREVLFDLDTVARTVFERDGKTPEFDLISKSRANLLRMWSDV